MKYFKRSEVRGTKLFVPFFLLLFFCSPTLAKESALNFSLNSYTYSDPTSIDSFINNFDGKLVNGDHAVTYQYAELGHKWQNFYVAIIGRYDWFFEFTPDTARLYENTENSRTFDSPQQYSVNLRSNQITATGLKVGYTWHVKDTLSLTFMGSYLNTTEFNDGNLSGNATWQEGSGYEVNAPGQLYASENLLLSNPVANASGDGYAFDLSASWQITPKIHLDVMLQDLWNEISWKNALFSQINRWQIIEFNEDNQLDTRPVIEGATLAFTQKLPKKLFAEASYQFSPSMQITAELFSTSYFNHVSFGLEKSINENFALTAAWHAQTKALELGVVARNWYFRISADTVNFEQAQHFGINSGLVLRF